jgi:stress response protein SCP2
MVTVSDMIGKRNLPATPSGTVLNIQKDTGVKVAATGIEWDAVVGGASVDVDVWMLLLGANGQCLGAPYFVFYNNRFAPGNCAYVTEDNRTGADDVNKSSNSDGYDELAVVTFGELPAEVSSVIVGVSIDHTAATVGGQTFAVAKNARAIVYDLESKKVLAKCDMSTNMTQYDAIVLGKYNKTPQGFNFESIMKGYSNGIVGAIGEYGLR